MLTDRHWAKRIGAGLWQHTLDHSFHVRHLDQACAHWKENIGNVGVKTTIQLAERDGIGVEDININCALVANIETTLVTTFDWGDKLLDWHRFDFQVQTFGYRLYDLLEAGFVQVIAHIIKVEGGAWAAQQTKRAAAEQG